MAIIKCSNCGERTSSLKKTCPHCGSALSELSVEEQERARSRRYKQQLYRAANLSYLALAFLITGAVWWWFDGIQGWALPPPVGGIAMVLVGAGLYLIARGWVFFLRLNRNRR